MIPLPTRRFSILIQAVLDIEEQHRCLLGRSKLTLKASLKLVISSFALTRHYLTIRMTSVCDLNIALKRTTNGGSS